MREILFRGKRKDNDEWVEGNYGEYYNGEKKVSCISIPSKETISVSLCYKVIPETVGQYTGLTDKNGTKIFEGDILSAHLDDGYPENETMLEVVWHNNGWYGKNGKFFDDFDNGFEKYFEVIGNIHADIKWGEIKKSVSPKK